MEKIIEFNDKLAGLPSGVLVFLMAIGLGYTLKAIKNFPNNGIPLVVVCAATAIFMVGAPYTGTLPFRMLLVRNFCMGVVIGVASWLFHKILLKRLEKRFGFEPGFDSSPEAFRRGAAAATQNKPGVPASAPQEKEKKE